MCPVAMVVCGQITGLTWHCSSTAASTTLISWESCFCDGCAGRRSLYASHLSSPTEFGSANYVTGARVVEACLSLAKWSIEACLVTVCRSALPNQHCAKFWLGWFLE